MECIIMKNKNQSQQIEIDRYLKTEQRKKKKKKNKKKKFVDSESQTAIDVYRLKYDPDFIFTV